MNLEKYNTIYYFIENEISTKIAAFDLDYTLIKPKSNKLFPKDKDDLKFLYEKKIKNYLKNLINNGYSIVIFTNQKGLSQNKLTISDFSHKINEIKKNLDIQFSIFISTINDKFRKPLTGAWQFFCEKKKIKVDYDNSFYVGDAAGRKYNEGHDHTNDDRNFAFNIKLKFFTPERFFDEPEKEHTLQTFDYSSKLEDFEFNIPTNDKNIIMLVGPPASGKSYISKKYFNNYKRINQDTLKTLPKCLNKTIEYAIKNKNIIIDNTNPNLDTRNKYYDIANKYGYNKYIINMNIPKNNVKYMNMYRTQTEDKKYIPDIAYNIYHKKHNPPTSNEGTIFNYNNYYVDPNYRFL